MRQHMRKTNGLRSQTVEECESYKATSYLSNEKIRKKVLTKLIMSFGSGGCNQEAELY